MIENLVICGAVRTPFGFGNGLQKYSASDLLEIIFREVVDRYKLDPNEISGVITGAVQQDTKGPNIARIASMKAGFPFHSRDFTVHNNCNSGFKGIFASIGEILMGEGDLYIVGGVESMSNFGYRLHPKTNKYGTAADLEQKLNENGKEFADDFDIIDCLAEGLTDPENDMMMIDIAEIMANLYKVDRKEQENYTLQNLTRAVDAVESGILDKYIVELEELKRDAYPLNRKRMIKRPESFARAALIFGEEDSLMTATQFYQKHKKHLDDLGVSEINPTVTMYNACIPGDGAGACIVTTEEKAKSLGLTPLLRIIGWASAGVNPAIMGIGPVEAVHNLFTAPKTQRAKGLEIDNMDVIEIHEAFAAQVLSVFKESENKYGRKWDLKMVNPYGGSLAFTHPLGATNFRLLANMLSRFDEIPSARYGFACGCAGGGHGASMLFERYTP